MLPYATRRETPQGINKFMVILVLADHMQAFILKPDINPKEVRAYMAESDKENEHEHRKAELCRLPEEIELTREQRAFIESMLEDDEEKRLDEP